MTEDHQPRSAVERIYALLVDDDEDHGRGQLDHDIAEAVPGNAGRQVLATTLQKIGDLIVDAKTVLSWLLVALGAPASLAGLLVPIRESGSMLPQAALVPWVRRQAIRKWVWVLGALLQAVAVAGMALIAATLEGVVAGVAVLVVLALFSLARSLSSIASKDVLGRTLPKGTRGQITGYATIGAGIASITVGLGLRLFGGQDASPSTFAWLLAGAAAAWVLAAAVFARVKEAPGEQEATSDRGGATSLAFGLLRDDAPFRRFVVARTLLLVSALSPPFIVTLATEQGGAGLRGLGAFVISSGIAALIGGPVWGRLADRSSRKVMMLSAGLASGVVLVFLGALTIDGARELTLLYPLTYLLLALVHHGARIGRKTYVVDLAEGNKRTDYVAVSNTTIAVLLLIAGGLTSALAIIGPEAALAALAALGLLGVVVSGALPEVSEPTGG
ncbi:MAG: MFS transporter [Nitriliruptoraceae bacterium]